MTAVRIQADFFARMEGSQTLRELFEHIPGVFFFVKDAEGRHITANRAILRRYGVKKALLIFQWVVFTGAGISKPPAIQYAIAWKLAKFRYPRARRRASCSSPLTASIAADVV